MSRRGILIVTLTCTPITFYTTPLAIEHVSGCQDCGTWSLIAVWLLLPLALLLFWSGILSQGGSRTASSLPPIISDVMCSRLLLPRFLCGLAPFFLVAVEAATGFRLNLLGATLLCSPFSFACGVDALLVVHRLRRGAYGSSPVEVAEVVLKLVPSDFKPTGGGRNPPSAEQGNCASVRAGIQLEGV